MIRVILESKSNVTTPNDMRTQLKQIEFRNYKAFSRFTLTLHGMNILVGPNSSGKSTAIGAIRILASALRTARSKKPAWIEGPNESRLGFEIPTDSLPISLENVHTDYSDSDTLVTFSFTNGNILQLYFPKTGGCRLIPVVIGTMPRSVAEFKSAFPFSIAVIPVLGPIEHNENRVTLETVNQNLMTHRASRHFRNYWLYNEEGFDEFSEMVEKTWPGMTIGKPFVQNRDPVEVYMFAEEDRIRRELYWCGFGFQTWCQLLTHISRNSHADLLVVDEPEIYLHADVQRQLLTILRDHNPTVILATHSTEIMGEADPAELIMIDKSRHHAQRLQNVDAVQNALRRVGSIHNITLVQLARTRRVIYVEDVNDFVILKHLASRLGLKNLASGARATSLSSGGFGSWKEIMGTAKRIEQATGSQFKIATIYDRDYRTKEEISEMLEQLNKHLTFAEVFQRKEVENYLLVPAVLDRLIVTLIVAQHNPEILPSTGDIGSEVVLMQITDEMRHDVQAQYIAERCKFFRSLDPSRPTAEATRWFDEHWNTFSGRMCIAPGKKTLRLFKEKMQELHQVSFSDIRIADEFRSDEIPNDFRDLLQKVEDFCMS